MARYSAWAVFKNGLSGQTGWARQWRDPAPKPGYDIVIVGAGLHGLATAYYLAANHGLTNIAVLEKGWLGGGNAGRNTTIVRSNYMMPGNRAFYEHSLRLWEGLSHALNYNVMFSQRSHVSLLHSPAARDAAAVSRLVDTTRARGYSVRDAGYGGAHTGTGLAHAAGTGDDGRSSIALPILLDGRVLGCVNLTWRRAAVTLDQVVERHLVDLRAAVHAICQRAESRQRQAM